MAVKIPRKQIDALKKQLGVDTILCGDYETYWASDYSLSSMATTDYVWDDRFQAQLFGFRTDTDSKVTVLEAADTKKLKAWAKTINWKRTAFLGHHTHFDGLIASHHHGIKPAFYLDTLSMARAVMPVQVARNLDSLSRALGGKGKTRAAALIETKGLRWEDFTTQQRKNLIRYGGDDVDMTWDVFLNLVDMFPLSELRLIDTTVKMYAQPRVLMDQKVVGQLMRDEEARKQGLLIELNTTAKALGKDEVFADMLRKVGVEPPMKWSNKKEMEVFAFAKNDEDFKAIADGEFGEDAQALAVARMEIKSNSVITRATRFYNRAPRGPQPVYLNYWGAGTGRWSGGDKVNWQNLKRGSALRTAVYAPPGYTFIIADLSQIEARVNAWTAGQNNIVQAFFDYDTIVGWKKNPKTKEMEPVRAGPDIYRLAAAAIFNKRVEDVTPAERFIGKQAVLGLGYGAGAPKFAHMLRTAPGAPKDIVITDTFASQIHKAWRQSNAQIVSNWKQTHNLLSSAFLSSSTIDDGPVSYEGLDGDGYMHLPNGMFIRYDNVRVNGKNLEYMKICRHNKTKEATEVYGKLYGGLEVENRTQALARIIVSDHALNIADELKSNWQLVMTTHDELVGLVPTRYAAAYLKKVIAIMSKPSPWASGLPVAVDAHISQAYDK